MQNIAGSRIRNIFAYLVENRLKSSLIGFSLTTLTQSPTAIVVLTIGFVTNGIITLVDGIAVILGSTFGASLILQFAAFNPVWLFIPLLLISLLLRVFSRQGPLRDTGSVLFGLSLLMFGISMMTASFDLIRHDPDTEYVVGVLQEHLLLGALCSAFLTIIVQNSTAVIALIMALAASGHLSLAAGFALIIGANIGSCAPTVFASIHGSLASRRVAAAHCLVTLGAAGIVTTFFPFFLGIVSTTTPEDADFIVTTIDQAHWYQTTLGDKPFITRHLANANTFFALFTAMISLPFLRQIARLTTFLVRGREKESESGLHFIDFRVLNTPPIALAQARSELRRMAQTAREALHETIRYLEDGKSERLTKLTSAENLLDHLQKELTGFLVELSHRTSTYKSAREVAFMMHMVADFERIGDHCQSLVRLSQRRQEWHVTYSTIASRDLSLLAVETASFVDFVVEAMESEVAGLVDEARRREDLIDRSEEMMRNDHLQRLTTGECSVRPGLIFIDMVQAYERISDHAYSVAKCLGGEKE